MKGNCIFGMNGVWVCALLTGLVGWGSRQVASAQSCVPVITENKMAGAVRNKFGYSEFTNSGPPLKLYLHLRNQTTDMYTYWGTPYTEARFYDTHNYQMDRSQAYQSAAYPYRWTSPETTTCTGSAYYENEWAEEVVNATLSSNCIWSDDNWGVAANVFADSRWLPYYVTAVFTNDMVRTYARWTSSDTTEEVNINNEQEVTQEYTDQMLWDDIYGAIPALPADWAEGTPMAYSFINENRTDGELGRMEYRFKLPETETNTTYEVDWEVVTSYPDGTEVRTAQSEFIEGTGSSTTPAVGVTHAVDAPSFVPTAGNLTITLANVVAYPVLTADVTSVAGTGPEESVSSSCASCESTAESLVATTGAANVSAAAVSLSLGRGEGGRSVGSLRVVSAEPDRALATPAMLRYGAGLPEVEVVRVNNQIRQVRAPQALADVVTLDPRNKYEVRYYLPSQVGSVKVGETYPISGEPFVTWTVENPDTSGATFYQLRVTQRRASETSVYNYVYSGVTKGWKYSPPGRLRERETVSTSDKAAKTRHVISTVRTPGGPDALKIKRVFQRYAWGEGLVEETLSPEANPQTTSYLYYEATNRPGYTPLRQVVHPDGGWEYFAYDARGRKTAIYAAFGNTPAPGTNPPNKALCRVVQHSYDTNVVAGAGDDGTRFYLLRTFLTPYF